MFNLNDELEIVKKLFEKGLIDKDAMIICNGFKRPQYKEKISDVVNAGFKNCIPILDNLNELEFYTQHINQPLQLGIRIAADEEPNFEFYTSRLGVRYSDVNYLYRDKIEGNPNLKLKMLHFFINTGIKDNAYYWNELHKCLKVYASLKKECPSLDSLNIGGGFPVKNSLAFDYDYAYMVDEIIHQIKQTCDEARVDVPNIFTEFGSFTVGEAGGAIYEVLYQKKQKSCTSWEK